MRAHSYRRKKNDPVLQAGRQWLGCLEELAQVICLGTLGRQLMREKCGLLLTTELLWSLGDLSSPHL